MTFRKRGFQELVDDILTELTGGVVNEPIVFSPANGQPPSFPLEQTPVSRIASVTGTANGQFRQFGETDFQLATGAAIVWSGGTLPDEGSTFFVDYYPESARSPITDRNVGSVARTLVEAIGRELAVLYEQADLVYRSGFVDLAEGAALDFVVALLGLRRIRAGHQVGQVVFGRSTPAPGDITIPTGTVVVTPPLGEGQRSSEFETTATRTLRLGQLEVVAPIRFRPTPEQQSDFSSGQTPTGTISLIPKPIVGIETVTNPEATSRGAGDETDDQLRQRTKQALAEAGKSTVDALRAAVLGHGPGVSVVVSDLPRGIPGEVGLVIDGADEPDRRAGILQSVLATKAAGIQVLDSYSDKVRVTLALKLETSDDVQLSGEEARRVAAGINSAALAYVNGLKAGEDISRNALVALSLADTRLRRVTIERLATGRAGLVEDTVTRLRDAAGGLTDLGGFDHVAIGQLEKAETAEADVTVTVGVGAAEVVTAVRITVTLVGNPTVVGQQRNVQAADIQTQIETLARGFVEAPQRGPVISLAELVTFVEQGSGLFTVRRFPDSFLIAERLATGLVERNVETVTVGEKERAELAALVLSLLV